MSDWVKITSANYGHIDTKRPSQAALSDSSGTTHIPMTKPIVNKTEGPIQVLHKVGLWSLDPVYLTCARVSLGVIG